MTLAAEGSLGGIFVCFLFFMLAKKGSGRRSVEEAGKHDSRQVY